MNDKDSYFHPFPKRLRLLFDETRVSQQEVADFVGVSRQAVSQWKDGKTIPDCYNFKKVAEFFQVPLEYLYGDTESKVKENQALAESLGFSDFTIKKLRHWEKLSYFDISFTQLLSRIIETDGFNSFIIQSESVIREYIEHQLDLEGFGVHTFEEDDEGYDDQEMERFRVGCRARALGIRTIRAEDLRAFYRQRATESIGRALDEVAKQYYTENRERFIEERVDDGKHTQTDEQEG